MKKTFSQYDMRCVEETDVRPGVVLRETHQDGDVTTVPLFADTVVMKVSYDAKGASVVTLARPYLYVSNAKTTSPTALMGFEKLEIQMSRLCHEKSIYKLLVSSSGSSFTNVT